MWNEYSRCVVGGGLLVVMAAGAAAQQSHIFPTTPPPYANIFPPFDPTSTGATVVQTHVAHQIFDASLFSALNGGMPVSIERIAFSFMRSIETPHNSNLTFRFGYTSIAPSTSQAIPSPSGGGVPNASGPMTDFFVDPNYSIVFDPAIHNSSEAFAWEFQGTPFIYDPALGNLLMEIVVVVDRSANMAPNGVPYRITTSMADRSSEASFGFWSTNWTDTALHTRAMRTKFTIGVDAPCYANCDGSTIEPVLNVDDFTCFINEFAAAQPLPHEQQVTHYANCDGSTISPVLNVDDFTCFINEFAAGCR